MAFGLKTVVQEPHEVVVERLRVAVEAEGLTVLTMTDVSAALEESFGIDLPAQTAVGVCTPALAHAALEADSSVGLLVPCSIVVRATAADVTVVEAPKLQVIVAITGDPTLGPVIADASARLRAAFHALTGQDGLVTG